MPREKSTTAKPRVRNPRRSDRAEGMCVRPDRDDLLCTAYYEAGRAVATIALGLPRREDGFTGFTVEVELLVASLDRRPGASGPNLEAVTPFMIQILCGPVAEARWDRYAAEAGEFGREIASVQRWAALALCEVERGPSGRPTLRPEELLRKWPRIGDAMHRAATEAEGLVASHWRAIRATAARLARCGGATREEVRAIMARHPAEGTPSFTTRRPAGGGPMDAADGATSAGSSVPEPGGRPRPSALGRPRPGPACENRRGACPDSGGDRPGPPSNGRGRIVSGGDRGRPGGRVRPTWATSMSRNSRDDALEITVSSARARRAGVGGIRPSTTIREACDG